MFGIGPTELIVILVIALLVLGPQRLPELARSLGRAFAEFRRATADITAELDGARTALETEARKTVESIEKAAETPPAEKDEGDEDGERNGKEAGA